MLDTDHSFSPDLLMRLLAAKEKYNSRVISAIYQYKHPPHSPVANFWTENNKLMPLINWDREAEVIQVGSCGAGCMLIDRSVFDEIKLKLGEDPFQIRQGLSEDYSFCLRCKELNIDIDLALKIECHHVIRTPLSIQDYIPQEKDLRTVELSNGTIVESLVK
jgi:GT2 family glycosyltransferase